MTARSGGVAKVRILVAQWVRFPHGSSVDAKGDGKNAVGVVSSHSSDLTMVSRGSVGYTRTGNLLRSVVG